MTGREIASAVGFGAVLATRLIRPWQEQGLVLAGLLAMILVDWTWRRLEDDRLRSRLASTFLSAFFAAAVGIFSTIVAGASFAVLVIAVAVVAMAMVKRARLHGALVPAEGEAHQRMLFEGTVHATGDPARVPGTEMQTPMWVARQGRRWWSSASRVELRNQEGKVWVDPRQARLLGDAWKMGGLLSRAVAGALDGADGAQSLKVWYFAEGQFMYVIGGVILVEDPQAPSYRDPDRVRQFSGDLLVGAGPLALVRRDLKLRVLLWTALALCAAVSALALWPR